VENILQLYCMSSQTNPMTTPYPYPYTYSPDEILTAMQNQGLNNSIYDGTEKVLKNTSDSTQFLNSGIHGLSKDVSQATLGLRDAIERGNLVNAHTTERTSAVTQSAIERNGGESRLTTTVVDAASRQAAADQARDILRAIDHNASGIASAVERNGNAAQVTSERINGFLASAIDRNGNAAQVTSERIGGTITSAIERNAGENRLTTTVTDAASREAAAGQARDLAIAIERNGANGISATQTTYSGLLGTIERNAGETRLAGAIASGVTDNKLTDVRHAILNDVNRGTNELLAANTQNLNFLNKAVTDSAWENRMSMTHGFANTMVDALKSKGELSLQSAQQYASMILDNQKLAAEDASHYASLLLEQQKLKEYLSSKGDSHFAMNQLEMQKVREGITSQSAQQFAINQLEMQKVKEGLACQAAQNFSITQLESQKSTALISAQLAEAKYEALKSQQLIVEKMGECCCEVKEKMDLIDRDRLRDNLVVEREDNNLLKILEFTELYGDRGRGSRGRHHGRR
jgi:polyhydroxyalkanoate synthesis regulator phasin